MPEADLDTLKSHRFTGEDVWDIAGLSAFFGLSNRITDFTNMCPNGESYSTDAG